MSPMEHFDKPHFARAAVFDRDGSELCEEQEGAEVAEVLVGHVLRGLCAGPLAAKFADDPEGLGRLAARIVQGVHDQWYEDDEAAA